MGINPDWENRLKKIAQKTNIDLDELITAWETMQCQCDQQKFNYILAAAVRVTPAGKGFFDNLKYLGVY